MTLPSLAGGPRADQSRADTVSLLKTIGLKGAKRSER